MVLYVETAKSTNNFYIDDARASGSGGSSSTVTPTGSPTVMGDLNGDGKINVYDVTLGRKFLVKGFGNNSGAEAVADVTGDGTFNASDVAMIQN